jgi:hypothetical protein
LGAMQLKLPIGDATTGNVKSYGVSVSCNKCGDMHDMEVSVTMTDGPIVMQSIASLFAGKALPKVLSDLSGNSVTCPKTGRQTAQKNGHHIFLIPPKS